MKNNSLYGLDYLCISLAIYLNLFALPGSVGYLVSSLLQIIHTE